jgi:hypothetical protein
VKCEALLFSKARILYDASNKLDFNSAFLVTTQPLSSYIKIQDRSKHCLELVTLAISVSTQDTFDALS